MIPKSGQRFLMAVGVVLIDALIFALPLTALFACYVLLARPVWFRDWICRMYED